MLNCAALFLLLGHAASILAQSRVETVAQLQARLTEHISQPRFASAVWGVKVVSIDSGKTLFEHNADKLLKPASNAKLYTGALALDRLGPKFRIKTSLYSAARPSSSGTLHGDLIVYGRGDPCYAARFHNGSHTNLFAPLVDALVAVGVKRIKGDLVGDQSFFRCPPIGDGWMWNDLQYYYGAEASALTFEDNVIDLILEPGARVGAPCRITPMQSTTYLLFSNRTVTAAPGTKRNISFYRPIAENTVYVTGQMPLGDTNDVDAVAVHQPALWFLTMLKEALAKRHITVSGRLRTVNWLDRQVHPLDAAKLVELGSVESSPLSEILTRMMKPSQNLYAHLLLLQVGANSQMPESGQMQTDDAGLAELHAFLEKMGINKSDVRLQEGSGLSRDALVTPNATSALLQFMNRHRYAEEFRAALPVAGVDGTLRNRMKGTRAAGNAHAKTGTLRYVYTLSGYVTSGAGEQFVFCLMLNNYTGSEGREALDTIVEILAGLESRL